MPKPTEITEDYWVYHGKLSLLLSELKEIGKWMLFYPDSKLDSKWAEICGLYDENKLPGILSMKCSTSLKSSRANNHNEGVIILYCNNSSNKTEILNIGKRLVPYIEDYQNKTIYYKTDIQTRVGTVATGAITNHTYSITIENPYPIYMIRDED